MSELEDLEQIRQLKARYFRFMDTKQWELLATVFTDDVNIDMIAEGGATCEELARLIFGDSYHHRYHWTTGMAL